MFKKTRLDNGMTVVMEKMTNLRSVSIGIWVKVGSRNEQIEKSGISHFLEHMFFKGTKKRTSRQIAVDIDSLGGELNAFTSKEGTTFYIKVLDEHLEKGVELLSDVFLHPTFPEDELKREKGVVIEEIKMVEDTPDEYIHDIFSRSVWGRSALGQSVLGRKQTVKAFERKDLFNHIKKYYGTADTIVACAGKFEEDRLTKILNKSLYRLRQGKKAVSGPLPDFKARTIIHSKDLSEAHICLGVCGIKQASKDRYCLLLLNTIFGGGLSSRLFQEIREKRGLAYSVYSFLSSYSDTGLWGVYAGTSKRRVNDVIEQAIKELNGLHKTITEEELQRAKDQLKGNLILGLESTSRRMQNIAVQQIYFGKLLSPQEIMEAIDSVTLERARELAERLAVDQGKSLAVLGPIDKSDIKVSIH
jgi:predicted Zn-dependent peptidase